MRKRRGTSATHPFASRQAPPDAPSCSRKGSYAKILPLLRLLEELSQRAPHQFRPLETGFPNRSRIDGLNDSVGVQGQDDIGCAFDHGLVARVLTLAQDLLAMGGAGDVRDLQHAFRIGAFADWPGGHVMDETLARSGPKRQQIRVQRVGQEGGRAELEGFRNRGGQATENPTGDRRVRRRAR